MKGKYSESVLNPFIQLSGSAIANYNSDGSILKALGCRKMNCFSGALALYGAKHIISKARDESEFFSAGLAATIEKYMPYTASAELFNGAPNNGCVFYFNYTSLGEIARMIAACLNHYPGRELLFPVNLIWYDILSPIIADLKKANIIPVPIITPQAKTDIIKASRWRYESKQDCTYTINVIATKLLDNYHDQAINVLKKDGIVLISPDMERSSYIFQSHNQRLGIEKFLSNSVTLLVQKVAKECEDCSLVPLAVVPPIMANRHLNLGCNYELFLAPDKTLSITEAFGLSQSQIGFHNSPELELTIRDNLMLTILHYYPHLTLIHSDLGPDVFDALG